MKYIDINGTVYNADRFISIRAVKVSEGAELQMTFDNGRSAHIERLFIKEPERFTKEFYDWYLKGSYNAFSLYVAEGIASRFVNAEKQYFSVHLAMLKSYDEIQKDFGGALESFKEGLDFNEAFSADKDNNNPNSLQ